MPQVIAQITMAIVTAALPLTFQRAAISSREWRNAKKPRIGPLRLPVRDFAAEKDGR
ncbi:hypothetical protein AWB78_03268 [Caballeronia calidae]|uniref:Uncharacterized protein n=1 Tax=Caballeronia calidae TaxID=1777139 RepID=A0A158C112_9BURK|nr:hypothetical protein [Caballeronia calidae]SAK75217.1 hypothetical protein AWB78_03268 [Caballeronia calidae]